MHELFFGVHSPWRVNLLNLDTGGKGLVLHQLDMPNFVDFPWDALPLLRNSSGELRGILGGVGGGEGVGTVVDI